MATPYPTLDYLSDLTVAEMAAARHLDFTPYAQPAVGWDVMASVSGSEPNALLHGLYSFNAVAGASYDIFSSSVLDPYLLRVYDAAGNTLAANDEADDGPLYTLGGSTLYSDDVIYDWVAPYTGSYYVQASWNQGATYPSRYSLNLFGDLDTAPRGDPPTLPGRPTQPTVPAQPTLPTTITGTARADTLTGNTLDNRISGLEGNDTLVGGAGNDTLDGGNGIDTARYDGKRADFTLTRTATGWTVSDRTGAEGSDTLLGIERLKFADAQVALDTDGNAGQAYRLYQAAFNRAPDSAGLAWQIGALDGGASLTTVAQGFIASPEFARTYGTLDNKGFATQLYLNVLHRTPAASEVQFHAGNLDAGQGRAQLLAGFSESAENQANLVGVIGMGIVY